MDVVMEMYVGKKEKKRDGGSKYQYWEIHQLYLKKKKKEKRIKGKSIRYFKRMSAFVNGKKFGLI